MSFPRYECYKESGVEWLGEVPVGWEVKRVKDTTYLKGRVGWKGLTSDEFLDEGPAYLVTGTDFSSKFIDWKSCYCVELIRYEDDPFIQLCNGDLLITKDGTIGKLALVTNLDKPACLNSGIFLVRPENSYITHYLYWILNSKTFSVFSDLTSTGSTIQHLYQNVFERFSFPIPSLPEQHTIAAFLDCETGKIDELVAEQERLIELLKEKRQATISHAVTKGRNQDAPMKDSGIGPFGSALTKDMYVSEGYRVYGQEQVIPGDFTVGDYFISPEKFIELQQYQIAPGDILISCVGTFGKIAIVPKDIEPGIINPRLMRVRCAETVSGEYLATLLRSDVVFEQFSFLSRGGTMDIINIGILSEIFLVVPPIKEQITITAFLDSETAKIDSLMGEAEQAIGLLKERRNALISAAVTGKIDVRGSG
jgi:type I restriction enzyme S subunit